MKNRTNGVTIFSFFFIVGGALVGIGALSGLVATHSKDFFESDKPYAFIRNNPDLTEETKAALMEQLSKVARLAQETMSSPALRSYQVSISILSGFSVLGGIGLLALKEWARRVVLFQTCVTFLLNAWWSFHVGSDLTPKYLEAFAGDLGPQVSDNFASMAQTIGKTQFGTALLFTFIWLALVVWFFNRPSVKEQFLK